jgi:hypothetical protein
MNALVFESVNQANTRAAVEAAVQNYRLRRKEKNLPEATEEEIQQFHSKVLQSIVKSQSVNDEMFRRNEEALDKAEARRSAIVALATNAAIKFLQCPEEYLHEKLTDVAGLTKRKVVYSVIATFEKSRCGGQTIAYRYRVDDAGDLFMDYSIAFCRSDEEFNEIIGMEESYRKFMEGKVIAMSITHDKLGIPKLKSMGKIFKHFDFSK